MPEGLITTPHTTSLEDLRLTGLRNDFQRVLGQQLTHAMQTARGGTLRLEMEPLIDFLKRAYIMGREDEAEK